MSAWYEREMAAANRPMSKYRVPRFALVKECACGARYDRHSWSSLKPPRNGEEQVTPADAEGPEERLQLRNCAFCDSTISVKL